MDAFLLLQPCRTGMEPGSWDGRPAPRSPVPAVPGHTYTRTCKHDPVASPTSQEQLHQLLPGLGRRCCCRCYFLSVFLDIDTSSLHPQDGFQASILFPMATNMEPGNLNPLTRLRQVREEVGEPWPPTHWSLQLHTQLLESQTCGTHQANSAPSGSVQGCAASGASSGPGGQGDTEIPVASASQPSQGLIHLSPGWSMGQMLPSSLQHPAPAAGTPGMPHRAHTSAIVDYSLERGQSKERVSERKGGGRRREQANRISSNQNRRRQ